MRKFTATTLFLLSLFTYGCAAWAPSGGGVYEDWANHYSVFLPEGWFMNDADSALYLTRNGPELQYIFVQTKPLGKPLIYTKKNLYSGMSGLDMAEYFLENNTFDQRVGALKMTELSTGQVLGYPGFKMEGTYENADGLTHAFTYYGFMTEKLYYGVSYSAPERVYYGKDLPEFKQFFSSFRILQE